MCEWMPIDSAPKDGTLFLCWVDAIRHGEADDGSTYQADVSECDFGQWRNSEHGGYFDNMMGPIGDGQIITHWIPLPVAPKSARPQQAAQAVEADGDTMRSKLLLGFMLDCNAIGAKEAGINLARSMKMMCAALDSPEGATR